MKRIAIGVMILVAALAAFSAMPPDDRKAAVLLQAGTAKETVQGDLGAAIELYRQAVKEAGANHAVAAKALLRMGRCYEKLGNAEARKAYEQILAKFGDQTEAVRQARARLAALGAGRNAGQQASRLVWTGPKVSLSGSSVSSDGRFISHLDRDTGNVAVHDLASGANRFLTSSGSLERGTSGYATHTAISRDGKRVAYSWFQAKSKGWELWVASLIGDPAPRRLYADEAGRWLKPYDWSPDGKWVAVCIGASIGLIAAGDGSLRVLKSIDWRGSRTFPNRISFPKRLAFSPDGKYLAYDRPRETGRDNDVFVLAIDGSGETTIAGDASQEYAIGWSPDGQYLLFASDRTGSTGLWALRFQNGKPREGPELIKADLGRGVVPIGLTAVGSLYYGFPPTTILPRTQVATVDFATGRFLSAPIDVASEGVAEAATSPDWSPDGKFLAYIVGTATTPPRYSVKIRSADTGEVRELQPPQYPPVWLRWAPDGQSFAVLHVNGAFTRVNPASGEFSPLLQKEPRVQGLDWSPDGKALYFKSPLDNGWAFVRWDIENKTEREIIRRPYLGGLNLSPDGKYLATMLEPLPDCRTMLLIPTDGEKPRELIRLDRKGYTLQPMGAWTSDSQSVYARVYVPDNQPGEEEIWQVPVNGDAPRKLNLKFDKAVLGFRLHPDGRRIAFTFRPGNIIGQQFNPGEVWVLEQFLPALKPTR